MFEHPRPVRWSDIDAAGIVYFPRFLDYCHDAIEALFGGLTGGYPRLTQERRIGVPTVHLEADFRAPLRYGDTCLVRVEVAHLGEKSIRFRHTLVRKADQTCCAIVNHVVATTHLDQMRAVSIPDDVRTLLQVHAG